MFKESTGTKDAISRAEILVAVMAAEHHLSYKLADSEIAKGYVNKGTKCSDL